MISRFPAQRRAEAFHAALESGTGVEGRDADLLQLAASLRSTPPPTARPEFVASLREQLMAQADAALALEPGAQPAPEHAVLDRLTVAPRRSARDRRFAAAAAGLALVGATGAVAVASQSALPGDPLYPVKRAIENAETGFSVNEHAKGSTLLANAEGRLVEADALTRRDEGEAADEVAATLDAFTVQATAAAELLVADYEKNANAAAIAELRDFTAASMAQLTSLESSIPEGARGSLVTAAQVLTRIDAEAQSLCSVCGGEGITAIPPQFVTVSVENMLAGLAGRLVGPAAPDVTGSTSPATTTSQRAERRGESPRPGGKSGPADVAPPGSPTAGDGSGSSGEPLPGLGSSSGDGDGGDGRGDGDGGGTKTSLPTVGPVVEDAGEVLGEVTGSLLGQRTESR